MINKTFLFVLMAIGVQANSKEEVVNGAKALATKLCTKAGAADMIDQFTNTLVDDEQCMRSLFPNALFEEALESIVLKSYEDPVKMMCSKRCQVRPCIRSLINGTLPCLSENLRIMLSLTETKTAADFACSNDEENLMLFYMAGGAECLQAKDAAIRICFAFDQYAPEEDLDQECSKLRALMSCIVTALKGCAKPTPAQIAESFFNSLYDTSKCNSKSA